MSANNIGAKDDTMALTATEAASVIALLKGILSRSGGTTPEGEIVSQFTVTDDGELYTTETEREINVRAGYSLSGIQGDAWAVLVDLSDTTNWPHDDTGRIDISQISMQVDKAANSTGVLQVGVVLRVDATNGDFLPIAGIRFENGTAAENLVRDISYSPSQVKCGVVNNDAHKILANGSKVLNNTGLQSDTAIPSARGVNVIPAVGDIVVRFDHTSGGAWTGGVGIMYHSHAEAT